MEELDNIIIDSPRYTKLTKERVIKNILDNNFDKNVMQLIVDIDYIKIKYSKRNDGYRISIIQKDKESSDIVEFFIDKFKKRYKDSDKAKFIFEGYSCATNRGKDVSNVIFFYKYNLFEKSFRNN
jgi:hypothetical protein